MGWAHGPGFLPRGMAVQLSPLPRLLNALSYLVVGRPRQNDVSEPSIVKLRWGRNWVTWHFNPSQSECLQLLLRMDQKYPVICLKRHRQCRPALVPREKRYPITRKLLQSHPVSECVFLAIRFSSLRR
jgi:hypothetical protein